MTEVVTEKFITEERGGGVHDATVMVQHITAPGGEADPFKNADLALATKVRTFLLTRFPVGYEWCVCADLANRNVRISIPILMGVKHWMFINLMTTPLDQGVLRCAGEILERYGLSRTHFDVSAFLGARELHSKLVSPRRAIPT